MKIYYTTDAHGFYLGSTVVTKARSEEEARNRIYEALKAEFPNEPEETLRNFKLEQMKEDTRLLWNGDY